MAAHASRGFIVGVAVLRNHAAQADSRAGIQIRQHRFEYLAADVLEVNVDAVRARRCEIVGQSIAAMGDASVVSEFLYNEATLLGRARDAHDTTSNDLGNLSYHLTDAARRCRYDNGFIEPRRALHHEAGVSSETEHAHDADRGGKRRDRGVELARKHVAEYGNAVAGQSVGLPTVGVEDEVAGFIGLDSTFDHLRHRSPMANLANRLDTAAATPPLIRI